MTRFARTIPRFLTNFNFKLKEQILYVFENGQYYGRK